MCVKHGQTATRAYRMEQLLPLALLAGAAGVKEHKRLHADSLFVVCYFTSLL